jgi:hypothetical protein
MPKYVKRPSVVEAFQLTPDSRHRTIWPVWMQEAWRDHEVEPVKVGKDDDIDPDLLRLKDGKKWVTVEWGDWILCHFDGRLTRCSRAHFPTFWEAAGD